MKRGLIENRDNISKIIFITGGTKSGKSELAEYIAKNTIDLTYIALSETMTDDINWQKKISIHRERRPSNWGLIETNDLINTLNVEYGPILVDSIGGFVMESINKRMMNGLKMDVLIDLLRKRKSTLIVGEQVGWVSLVQSWYNILKELENFKRK